MPRYMVVQYSNGIYIEGGIKDYRISSSSENQLNIEGLKEFIKMLNEENKVTDKKDQLLIKLMEFVIMVQADDYAYEKDADVVLALCQWEVPTLYEIAKELYNEGD